jgi:serine/threonine protein kinase
MAIEGIVGTTIAGKYRVRRIVGGGSMGVVCEAEHLEIGKRVAIKLIDASLTGMSDVATRFRQEARATSLVESNHIVQVFDVGTDDELGLYLVMEYLAGEDLARMLAREGRLPVDTAVRIALQVARGLAKAHEVGVVHRDLKPANIFLCASEDSQPMVKILDFGISKVIESSRASSARGLKVTRDGMVVGTPQYMSPEQAQGFSVDERTDVWALGLVLYEMLAGRPAYRELPTYEQFIIHLVSKPPDPLREVAPWVPDALASVVHGAVEHDVTKRIQSCTDLVAHLDGTSAAPRHGAHPLEASETWSAPTARSPYFDASLVASGVRGTASDSLLPSESFEEDAPQFFDRKALQTISRPSPRVVAFIESSEPSSPGPPPSHSPRRIRPAWAGLALLTLGLVVVAALALR